RLEILRRAPLFSGLDDATLMAVLGRMESVMVEGGKPLITAGDPGDALYVVASGYLAVFDPPGPDGIPRIIAEIPAGDIVGELSLIAHPRRSHTVAAIRDSEALRLSRAESEAAFVVYRADATETDWTHRCLRQADLMLVVALAGSPPEEPQLIDRLNATGALREGPYRPRRELVLVREKPLIRPGTTSP